MLHSADSRRNESINSIANRGFEKSRQTSSRRRIASNVALPLFLLIQTERCSARATPETSFISLRRRQSTTNDRLYTRTKIYALEQKSARLLFPSPPVMIAKNSNNRINIIQKSKIKHINNHYTEYTKDNVLVGIESTSTNSRRISGEMLMDIPVEDVWSILTDYDNLATHVPNLVESRIIDSSKPRVYQRGAQKIFGFEFGADVTMDMTERIDRSNDHDLRKFAVDFKCVESHFFSQFDGSWIVEECANDLSMPGSNSNLLLSSTITSVQYIVDVRPKGPVPVAALEWRIKEDVPTNILAVSNSARSRMLSKVSLQEQSVQSRDDEQTTHRQNQNFESKQEQSPRRTSPLRKLGPRLQPFHQMYSKATNFLKETADSYLPPPASNIAKQALNILDSAYKLGRRRQDVSDSSRFESHDTVDVYKPRQNVASTQKNDSVHVEWYEDETMAMYLK